MCGGSGEAVSKLGLEQVPARRARARSFTSFEMASGKLLHIKIKKHAAFG
jgi:hypothetical protein